MNWTQYVGLGFLALIALLYLFAVVYRRGYNKGFEDGTDNSRALYAFLRSHT